MITWEYLSGFFDGEGTINFFSDENAVARRKRVLRLTIANTNDDVLRRIQSFLASQGVTTTLTCQDRRRRNPRHNDCWTLTCSGARNCYLMLNGMVAHLVIKQEKAYYVIEWLWDLAERAYAGEFDHRQGHGMARKAYLEVYEIDKLDLLKGD